MRAIELVVDGEEIHGEGGFLAVRRVHLRNRRADGSHSEPYICDFLVRKRGGADAVVVAVYRRRGDDVEVLLREGLRPALTLGRPSSATPVPDERAYLYFTEVVAGVIETSDRGEAGIRERARLEVEEEAGFIVTDESIVLLGAGTFPSPGALTEKFYLAAVEVAADAEPGTLEGDGSPMEEGARTWWRELDDAIDAFTVGEYEDLKSELALRRLRDRLRA